MNSSGEITSFYYRQAVTGLNEVVLNDGILWYSQIVNLPTKEQITYTVIVLNDQVLNGGFHQYFFNAYGMFAYITIENLRLINADEIANILENAVRVVNEEELDIDDFRDSIFHRKNLKITEFDDDLFAILANLDDEYIASSENLEDILVKFLLK